MADDLEQLAKISRIAGKMLDDLLAANEDVDAKTFRDAIANLPLTLQLRIDRKFSETTAQDAFSLPE